MNDPHKQDNRTDKILEMIGQMASLDFSSQLQTDNTDDHLNAIAQGLNWLSEELQHNVLEKSKLEEVNYSLERFAYVAAHDIKSPLRTASLLIATIEKEMGVQINQKVVEYLEMLKANNERAQRLIDGILKYSRISTEDMGMTEIDLVQFCSNIVAGYASNTKTVINIEKNLPTVKHNETVLAQIVDNLINNAIKYNDKETSLVDIQCLDRGDYYEMSVEDNGPGIAEVNREKVFDLFQNLRTDRSDSTGIGLAVVKKLVTAAKGRIWVESTINRGSKFIFTIRKWD